MAISVLIPFTSDDPWRLRARDHVVAKYREAGYAVTEGGCEGSWRKAVAVAHAARRTDGDIMVVADADCLSAGVATAIAAVEAGAPWAVPHLMVNRLDEAATEAVYSGTAPDETAGRAERPYRGFEGGGIVVLPRATYESIPLDPRFEGFGQEDEAWALALTCLAGAPWRGAADLHHLYHPPPPRLSRHLGSAASKQLLDRYVRAARTGRRAVRDLLDETMAEAA